jgi:unsaturated rhamnogalacturonyl hydrolase
MSEYAKLIADTVMRRYPEADLYPYKSWSYPQGFVLWGFIRLYEKTGEKKYMEYVLDFCDKHAGQDGRLTAFTGVSLDDMMTGSILVWAYEKTGKENYRYACDRIRGAFNDYPRNSDGGFWHSRELPHEMWVDGLFMGLMFLTRYGAFIGDKEFCFDETVRQLSIVFDRCEKDDSGLLYHAFSEDRKARWAHPITGKSPEIWCEGLGWYAMILPEVLELLHEDYHGFDRILSQLRKLISGLIKVQDDSSGLWYQVVDKPRYSRNWHDTSGSAMFLYCIKKSGLMGLYDKNACEMVSQKAFEGIKAKCVVDYEGNANIYDACNGLCVQESYDAYVGYARNVNCQEAIAAFLWAAQIMEYGA